MDCLASDGVVVSDDPLALRRSLGVQDDETGRRVTWYDDAIVVVWFFEGVAELPTEADHQNDDEHDAEETESRPVPLLLTPKRPPTADVYVCLNAGCQSLKQF